MNYAEPAAKALSQLSSLPVHRCHMLRTNSMPEIRDLILGQQIPKRKKKSRVTNGKSKVVNSVYECFEQSKQSVLLYIVYVCAVQSMQLMLLYMLCVCVHACKCMMLTS